MSGGMSRLDRYYIPPGVPARPPAPPLPRKGILMMPPPPLPPQLNQPPQSIPVQLVNNGVNPQVGPILQHKFPSSNPHVEYPKPGQAMLIKASSGNVPPNWSCQSPPSMQHALKQFAAQEQLHKQQSQQHHQQQQQQNHNANGPQSMPCFMVEGMTKIRPERMARRPLPKLYPPGMGNYEELPPLPPNIHANGRIDSQNLATAMAIPDSSPRLALQRILMLYENGEHREAAAFMRRISFQTFRQVLPHLPADIFIESMPHSLPILEALYAKLFLGGNSGLDNSLLGKANSLRPEAVVWQLVKFFAGQEAEGAGLAGQMRWEFCGPFISSCKRLLKVLLAGEPRARRVLAERKKSLMKAIEGLGQHGMVGTSDEQLMSLHDALKLEFVKVQNSYEEALKKLEGMALVNKESSGNNKAGTISTASGGKAPIAQSHQRQLSLKSVEIQERLIKNKTLLNVVEPTLENTSLEVLLGILQQRIELDKECLFQFTQVKKESHIPGDNTKSSIAPILMRYQRGCQQVLELMKEVSEDKEDDGEGSDISGYHSDSESAVMTSGNSPFISKEARYSFLSRSVRLGSKHNVRASILASSLCLESASLRSGSIKSGFTGVGLSTGQLHFSGRHSSAHSVHRPGPPSLVLHSSSGVSSGSTSSDNGDNGDQSRDPKPESPTPSASSSNTVVKRIPSNSPSSSQLNKSGPTSLAGSTTRVTPRPRHMKQRKEVFKGSLPGSTTGSLKSINSVQCAAHSTQHNTLPCCTKCGGDNASTTTSVNEPVYQGINDVSVMRKDNEISSLKTSVARLRAELAHAQKTIFQIKDTETSLKDRLEKERQRAQTLEKMASSNANKQSPSSGYTSLDQRPAGLVRRYGELYSQTRLETLDCLDRLPQLVNAEELKNKLLFSVMVLSFRSVSSAIQNKRDQVRRILQLPPPSPTSNTNNNGTSSQDSSAEETERDMSEVDGGLAIKLLIGDGDNESLASVCFATASTDPAAAKDLEIAITAYLRRATENFDLSKNVEEVCSQIWATLYDYPCLKTCDAIIRYIKECVRVAWGLVNQVPVYVIEYENRHFRPDVHVRFHSSDQKSDQIRTYLWPALREGTSGPCVQKGVVIT